MISLTSTKTARHTINQVNALVAQCQLCWERLEWKSWPDHQTSELISTMASAWRQTPAELRRDRWGQPLVPAIEAAWALALKEQKSDEALTISSYQS